jgi:hypothetical protein
MLADPLDPSTHAEGFILLFEVSNAKFLLRSATLNESLNRLNGECKRVRVVLKKCMESAQAKHR